MEILLSISAPECLNTIGVLCMFRAKKHHTHLNVDVDDYQVNEPQRKFGVSMC